MSESRARREIRRCAEEHGLVIEDMDWQPIGQMVEKSGREGGWTVFFEGGDHALGYHWTEVCEWIRRDHQQSDVVA